MSERLHPIDELFATIEERKATMPDGSYTARLLSQTIDRSAKKVTEEAGEFVIAAVSQSDQRVIEEAADLVFHTLIVLSARGLTPTQVYEELTRRQR